MKNKTLEFDSSRSKSVITGGAARQESKKNNIALAKDTFNLNDSSFLSQFNTPSHQKLVALPPNPSASVSL